MYPRPLMPRCTRRGAGRATTTAWIPLSPAPHSRPHRSPARQPRRGTGGVYAGTPEAGRSRSSGPGRLPAAARDRLRQSSSEVHQIVLNVPCHSSASHHVGTRHASRACNRRLVVLSASLFAVLALPRIPVLALSLVAVPPLSLAVLVLALILASATASPEPAADLFADLRADLGAGHLATEAKSWSSSLKRLYPSAARRHQHR